MKKALFVSAWAIALASVAFGAPLHAAAGQTAAATYRFDIPAGALSDGIAAFRTITGRTVVVPAGATVDGLPSPGVSGVLTADDALDRLLAGTGLGFRLTNATTYTLQVTVASERVEVTGRLPYGAVVTATATRTPTRLRDVPQAITVVTRAAMADQQMRSMADVVRYVPGAGMGQGEGNRDTPILRGNSTTGDFFVDGMRDDVQYFRDLYNVEQVEALKGPNAMIFGRGGAGGVINRTTRQADWMTGREFTFAGGSTSERRATIDINQRITGAFAARLTGLYENSGSYRKAATLERYGINPTVARAFGTNTVLKVGYERFHDDRTADRGIPSFGDRPVSTDLSTFFGDPQNSFAEVTVNALTSAFDHKARGGMTVRNRTRLADYDKFYQNVYPASAVSANGATASIAAYNNGTARRNVFSATDVNLSRATGRIHHTLLIGGELGRQVTDNLRHTGYFTAVGPTATALTVHVDAPTVSTPVVFRQSATDADNHSMATVAAAYLQDQIALSRHVQAVVGLRYDQFNVRLHNNRTGADLESRDGLVSPRLGLVIKPSEPLSLYASYSVAYLPRAGEQLASLSLTNQALDPEQFTNHEIGAKWDVRPQLSATAAVYQLDRTNVVIPDPNDATRSLLVDGQRTRGVELGLTGRLINAWSVMGGYTHQHGRITRTLSASARAGAALAQVPSHTFSLWNRIDFNRSAGVGFGVIHNSDMFTSTDNTVTLPAFTRVDGAVFVRLSSRLSAQVNVENLLDARYFAFSNGNNNITPASPRALRVSLRTAF